jgi:hypothetical protein
MVLRGQIVFPYKLGKMIVEIRKKGRIQSGGHLEEMGSFQILANTKHCPEGESN